MAWGGGKKKWQMVSHEEATDIKACSIPVTEMFGGKIDQLRDVYLELFEAIDVDETNFRTALVFVIFNPIFWNVVAYLEYSTHFLTKLAGGAKKGCYLLAVTIFSLGIARDFFFEKALRYQEVSPLLDSDLIRNLGYLSFILGQVLVLSSMYQLGITGTYLGDHFGILMKERVTAFPFNVSNNPMYQGSTLSFLGTSLIYGKPAGLFITVAVHSMYSLALKFEEPFTAKIYAQRDERLDKKKY